MSNKVPTCTNPPRGTPQVSTAAIITTNVNQNITEVALAAPIIFQVVCHVVFHPDNPAFTHPVITDGAGCPDLPTGTCATLASPATTVTAAPNIITPAAISSVKNSNNARRMDDPNSISRLHADPDSDVMLAVSSGESDDDLDYAKSSKNGSRSLLTSRNLRATS